VQLARAPVLDHAGARCRALAGVLLERQQLRDGEFLHRRQMP
jgi:hypothetical protein